MSFESPMMLLALAALTVPIWLHFRKSVDKKIPFPAVSVLLKVSKRLKKRIEFKQKILLLARILFITAVVFAVSRPGVSVTRPGGIRSGAEIGLAIIIDDSFSMRVEGGDGKTVFDNAKKLAMAEINRLRPGDGAALILSGHPVRSVVPSIELDLNDVGRQVEELRPGYSSGDLKGALNLASRILLGSPLPQREVIVITDLSDAFDENRKPWPKTEKIDLRILDAAKDIERTNVSVDQIKVSPSPQGEPKEVLIEARIANFEDREKKNFHVVLEVDGAEVARGSIDVPAGQSAIKEFYHRFTGDGTHRGLVRIENDSLKGDDVRHFSVAIRQSITALVVDGDYRPGSYRDEAFYLHSALEIPMGGEVPIRPVVVDVDTAKNGPLTGNDVVFIAGVHDLDKGFADRIVGYVKKGGGVFISPGAKGVTLDKLESILPAKVRSVRQASRSGRPFRIAAINRSHPVFSPFKSDSTGLEKTRVESHLLVEPEPNADRTTLIELTNGLPLLMERRVGMGRVMLLTTTVDRDWTDLPIRPGYFPLIQRSARHLSGRLGERDSKRIFAGRKVELEVTEGMQRLLIRSPSGKDTIYPAADLSGKSAISYTSTFEPGHYRVWAEIPMFGGLKELDTLEFVVEVDPKESDLSRAMEPISENTVADLAPLQGSLPIWPYLLIGVVFLLFFETLLGNWGLRKSHSQKEIQN